MANKPRSEHERHEGNGVAQNVDFRTEAVRQIDRHPVLQGWLLLGVGTILILFSFGYFPLLKWAVFAAGVALAIWGINKADLVEKVSNIYTSIRKRF